MWDAIATILTNSNALIVLLFMLLFSFILIILASTGLVRIDTGNFKMGADHKERDIIRQQTEWAEAYIMGLESCIDADTSKYGGYLTKYILRTCYDEVVVWITYNHINLESDYISIKQEKVKMLLASMTIKPDIFASKKFLSKVEEWTSEIIHRLVKIREVYK
jgi:hypothetical protein